tara:strand:+ start:466 stop:588 length:123 start_codon:yes stop_codon:yes gene_type:complete
MKSCVEIEYKKEKDYGEGSFFNTIGIIRRRPEIQKDFSGR